MGRDPAGAAGARDVIDPGPSRARDRSGSTLGAASLYRLLVDSVRDYAIFLLNPSGHVMSWNAGAERIKGYTREEIIGRHYSVFYPDDAHNVLEPDEQLEIARRDGRFEGEGWRLRKDGGRFWAHVVITALYDRDTLVAFGKVTGDKTAEHYAREQLRRRERQLAEAQQIAHLGSWEWDVDADVVTGSDELFRIYGILGRSELRYDDLLEAVHPRDRASTADRVRRTLETGEPFVDEHRLDRPEDEVRWVQARGEAIRDREGHVTRMVGTALDITDLKEAEANVRRLTAEQAARVEAERTARRIGFLAEANAQLGASIEYEETLRTVAWLAIPSFADWCAVDMVLPSGEVRRLAVAHMDPEKVELAAELNRRYPQAPDETVGVRRAIRTGEAELLPTIGQELLEAAAVDEEHFRVMRELGLRSALIVPIRVHDRSLGAISFVLAESDRSYTHEDLVIGKELAARAALAIENAQLHEAEREARTRAEAARERIARLQAITAGLSEAVTPTGVAEVVVEQAMAALGARSGMLALRREDGMLEVVRSVGAPDGLVQQYRVFDPEAPLPLAESIRTGRLLALESQAERHERFPATRADLDERSSRAVVAVPIRSGPAVIGGLAFGYAVDRSFDSEDREFMLALGRQCAQALERARLFETEHAAREAAEAASVAKSQFVAMMSHELRTPLSAIIGYQELLAEEIVGPVTDDQREHLDRIRASAAHLRDLINQILCLSRIEAGSEDTFPEEFDLALLVRDVALLMEREAATKGLDLRADAPSHEVEVETDPGKVRQILLNLVSNAIKFTDTGDVRVALEEAGEEVVIRVSDTGIGIPVSDLERVFEAFTQVDQSTTRSAGGSGLGLPVSRHLARLLGGTMDVSSEEGRGTTFTLRLPRKV